MGRKADHEWTQLITLSSHHTEESQEVSIGGSFINRTINERELSQKDQRNLYLLQEGFINEENRGTMNDRDLEKRKNSQKEKETKLKNPLFFVNPTRLHVKNLGPFITANYLKQICI